MNHILSCDEAHEHHAPKFCASDCWCKTPEPPADKLANHLYEAMYPYFAEHEESKQWLFSKEATEEIARLHRLCCQGIHE